jgi:hypothetical protein
MSIRFNDWVAPELIQSELEAIQAEEGMKASVAIERWGRND